MFNPDFANPYASPSETKSEESTRAWDYRVLTAISALLILIYPATIRPTGPLANGGALGMVVLAIAAILSWWSLLCNHHNLWLRRRIQVPLAGMASVFVVMEIMKQMPNIW